ncbi:CpaD family pilus assembly lipoprotein [Bradyrhizobium sp. LHD-71]|uniref:CpaD family pilus assembly lipoprotein n=1 Tax=Bradyrhizobium sp. LHD-71 TaxID=3072141 RepID=UPI00280F1F13|nr:CpaD family pilus assembly lipoprotein [Bradyrhizobium sp. LHD-71]MDQ8726876.1 CpaD family pilus assembly lipoprotein [Bradyrhizobium sp. LHD-71]
MRASVALLAVGLTAPLLSACNTYIETPPVALVEPAPHILLLSSGSGGTLASADRRRLEDFLYTASYGRLDAIHVHVVGINPRARYAVARSAIRMGVAPFKVKEINEPADERYRFTTRVVAVRYTAIPPGCPSLKITSSPNDNDFEPTLGCSNLANLATMVNDPKDLLVNSAVPPSDGERAAIPVARYRAFRSPTTTAPQTYGSGAAVPVIVPPLAPAAPAAAAGQ